MKKSVFIVLGVLLLAIYSVAMRTAPRRPEHSESDFHQWLQQAIESHRQLDTNAIFLPASRCKGCHGRDPQGLALVNSMGVDINLFDDWETSMMGMAGIDPLWRAKVRQEVLTNPSHALELQSLCTKCHAPMGHYNAMYRGQEHYTLEDLQADSLGLSGVGCLGCHAIGPNGLGTTFTGQIPFDTNRVAYGPFANPYFAPMQLYVNFTPVYSPHVSEGRVCSPCHTLISNAVDLGGQPTGTTFVEQATFHEWKNSVYPEQGQQCQTCHMPQLEEGVKIAVGYLGLEARSPFNLHTFTGANSFMVNLIKQNKGSLNFNAPDANFDSTLAAIDRNLRLNTIQLTLQNPEIDGDSVTIPLLLRNKAGHKFPSGYPSRRAIVSFVVTNTTGDTLFQSGVPKSDGTITGITEGAVVPHFEVIRASNQAQIYEMRMGDVNGNPTTVLERAYVHLKDNRIPPLGFSTQHASYDTMQIYGNALNDANFNHAGAQEGSGTDAVFYKLPINALSGTVRISAKVWYQSVPPYWLEEMRELQADEISHFTSMYDAADKMPVLIAEATAQNVELPLRVQRNAQQKPLFFPNPGLRNSPLMVQFNAGIDRVEAWSLDGRKVPVTLIPSGLNGQWRIEGLDQAGVYFIRVHSGRQQFSQKIIRRTL